MQVWHRCIGLVGLAAGMPDRQGASHPNHQRALCRKSSGDACGAGARREKECKCCAHKHTKHTYTRKAKMNVQWDVAPESAEAGPHDEANGAAASSAEPNRHAAVQAIASAAAAASTGSSSSSTSKSPETLDRLDAQLATAAKHKEEGNAHFASGNVTGAMTSWHFALLNSSGINALASTYGGKNTEEHTKRAQSITVAAQNNLASVYLTQGKYEKVVYATTKVLGLDEKNIKALYRRAKARLKLGQVKKAAEDVDKALEIDGKGECGVCECS